MLSAKPWKPEAIVRLLVALLVSQILGSVALAVVRFAKTGQALNPWLFAALVAGSVVCLGATLFVLRKPWELERFARAFVVMMILLYLGMMLGAFAQHFAGKTSGGHSTFRTIVATLSFQGAALLFIWCFVREHGVGWREAFGFSVNWKMALILGVAVGSIFLPLGQLLQMASATLMTHLNVKPEIQPAIQALQDTATWTDRVVIGIAAIGLAPIAEELLFRGILYPGIKQAGFPRAALWGTSLLFACIHWNLPTFVPLLLLAVTLTLLYEKTRNLLAPIAAHALFNALNFAMFYVVEAKSGPAV